MNIQLVSEVGDPSNSIEVAIDQRIVGLFSATKALDDMRHNDYHARLYIRESLDDLEIVRDKLSRMIDLVRGLS
jgi:hypothetical protein